MEPAHAEEPGTLVTKENGKKIAEGPFETASPGPTLLHTAARALTDTSISAKVAPVGAGLPGATWRGTWRSA